MSDSSDEREPRLPTSLVLLEADELRALMPRAREDYLRGNVQRAPLQFLATAALEEAQRAVQVIETFVDDVEALTAREDREFLCEQLAVRARRLAEAHVAVTLCGLARDEAHARHWLLLEKWSRATGENLQLESYHGHRSPWLEHLASDARTLAEAAASGLDLSGAWYLKNEHRRNLDIGRAARRPFGIFSSFGERLENAFASLNSSERFALGTSYEEAFGHASSLIHFSPAHPRDALYLTNAGYWQWKIELLALAVMNRVHRLLDAPTTLRSARAYTTPEGEAMIADLMLRPRVQVGMRVTAHELTGVVVGEATSRFGNRIVEIAFGPERPSPLIERDWIPVRFVAPAG